MNSTSLTVPFSADKRSYRLLFVPFLTLSCFDNPVLIFLGVAGTLWQTWKNKMYLIFFFLLLLSPLLSTFGIVTLFLIFLKVWLHAASLYFLNSLLLSSILLHIICVLENDRLVWLKFTKIASVLIDQSLPMRLLNALLHPIRVMHYTVLELSCCHCASSCFIEHSADIQPSVSASQVETLDDM